MKMKRLSAFILCALIVMSCGLFAFAAEGPSVVACASNLLEDGRMQVTTTVEVPPILVSRYSGVVAVGYDENDNPIEVTSASADFYDRKTFTLYLEEGEKIKRVEVLTDKDEAYTNLLAYGNLLTEDGKMKVTAAIEVQTNPFGRKTGIVVTGYDENGSPVEVGSETRNVVNIRTFEVVLNAGKKIKHVEVLTDEESAEREKKSFSLTIGNKSAKVFGEDKTNDVAPIIRNNRTMLPARFVAENLGATVSWDAENRVVTISGANAKGENVTIEITIDSDTAVVNGEKKKLDSPAFIENGRTYTPVRFIAECLGANVSWNGAKKEVIITKAE